MATVETLEEGAWGAKVFLDLLAVLKSLQKVKEAMEKAVTDEELMELTEEQDALTEMLDFLSWQFGHLAGYELLAQMRKTWGTLASMHNVIQERHYKAQKARYEECKRGKRYFTAEDREFIEHNKALNEFHMEARWIAADYRELFANIIEAAFPEAPFDLGWDENWVEA